MPLRLIGAPAQAAIPGCALLRFAQADMEEGAGNLEAAQQVQESVCLLGSGVMRAVARWYT